MKKTDKFGTRNSIFSRNLIIKGLKEGIYVLIADIALVFDIMSSEGACEI